MHCRISPRRKYTTLVVSQAPPASLSSCPHQNFYSIPSNKCEKSSTHRKISVPGMHKLENLSNLWRGYAKVKLRNPSAWRYPFPDILQKIKKPISNKN